ncbi:response regulator transcription factor [Pedobacter frigidisoli]|uniref:Response regulator transcription factor n=1 Tax=Pedobacter frigidisoli TaxID=2530455 RepID=A0A4R0NM91_9SPHI|nr:response regulator transcription factor [Pedobacter frigidisoli]TCD01972.1 response regulator transcription factor [Pedobacter frigidisoli]
MISVSIVEDHPHYRQSLAKAINDNSIFTLLGVYASAEEALAYLPTSSPDILIVDIKLKTKSGIELVRQIKNTLLFTQFLMCSSYQNDEYVFDALKAGAAGYILKGASFSEIHNAIIDLHNGGSPMSPFIARKVIGALYQDKKSVNSMGLSEREIEVLSLLGRGHLYKEISHMLEISPNTVKNHCKNIYKRLHVQNKVEALNKFGGYQFKGQSLVN